MRGPLREVVTRGPVVRITGSPLGHGVVSMGHEPPSDALLLASPAVKSRGAVWNARMSEAAWKAEKERIAQRNDETRKAGKKEREAMERERAERRRTAAARRDEAARTSHKA